MVLSVSVFCKKNLSPNGKETYLYFEQENLTSADAILEAGWNRLVEVLDSRGYNRYDFSTATNLLGTAKTLKEKYRNLEQLHAESSSPADLESRLQEFRWVGPVGVNIFLRSFEEFGKKQNRILLQ